VRQALTIARRDLTGVYLSPFGIGCTAGFAALAGVLLVFELRGGQARLDAWFSWLFVASGVLAALLAMRALAEEERAGSLELLLTAPLSRWQVVIGKLLGAAAVLVVVAGATLACPILVNTLGHPDVGPIVTGYAGLLLVGLAFVALALPVSAATGNPLVASTGALAVLAALWLVGTLGAGLRGLPQFVLLYLSPTTHVSGFLRGTLSVADVTYFASAVVAGAATAVLVLELRR
jgi:ABC-2 type transport system permease protein